MKPAVNNDFNFVEVCSSSSKGFNSSVQLFPVGHRINFILSIFGFLDTIKGDTTTLSGNALPLLIDTKSFCKQRTLSTSNERRKSHPLYHAVSTYSRQHWKHLPSDLNPNLRIQELPIYSLQPSGWRHCFYEDIFDSINYQKKAYKLGTI